MLKYFIAGLFSLQYFQITAGEVEHIDVQYQDGIYTFNLEMTVNARQADIWHIITDYENLDQINHTIIESEILQRSDNTLKHRLVTNTCILFFCNRLTLVENIEEHNNTSIHSQIDPMQSDFKFGQTEWTLQGLTAGKTRINYRKQFKPAFWVPPIIGPVLVKRKLRTEVIKSLERLEQLVLHE